MCCFISSIDLYIYMFMPWLLKYLNFSVTCWDISDAVENGDVTFDRVKLTEGTVATAKCDSGYTLSGSSTLTCSAGMWNTDLPKCSKESGEFYFTFM
jgi:hypothetical protein